MATADPIVIETAERIFRDLADPQSVNSATDSAWRAPLWEALEESGLTRAWLSDDLGGAGASMADGFAVMRAAGAAAVSVPVAETLIAAWLLGRAGLEVPDGAMTIAPARDGDAITIDGDDRLTGSARAVPFAAEADHLAVLAGGTVALVATSDCRIAEGVNSAGDACNEVTFDGARALLQASVSDTICDELMMLGATARSVQMSGALEAVLDITVEYAGERVAFGRPIARFQAVQHECAKLATETAAAMAAAGAAADALGDGDRFDDRLFFEVASAKIRVCEAARDGAAIAHQVHGAIGFTQEHILHRYTQRLLAWRDDFGAESRWAARLGSMVAAAGADALWPTMTAG
jgi:alkylation response protein AidB-like acyl-CoA dehydrogenase